jgi:hypothetical protein
MHAAWFVDIRQWHTLGGEAMLAPSEREAIEKGYLTLKMIWIAMLALLPLYVIVCHLFGHEIRQATTAQLPLARLRYIFLGLSLVTLCLIYYLRGLMLAVRSPGFGVRPSEPSSYPSQPQALGKYATAVIVSLALSGSIGMYGLVLFFLGGAVQALYLFIVISACAMVLFRPKREELAELAIIQKMRPHGIF